jgi:hypothetical protein
LAREQEATNDSGVFFIIKAGLGKIEGLDHTQLKELALQHFRHTPGIWKSC